MTEAEYVKSRMRVSDERSLQGYQIFEHLPPQNSDGTQQIPYLILEVSQLTISLEIELDTDARLYNARRNTRLQVA